MKYIIRIALVFCFIISTAFADDLEIKLSGKSIKLPFWPAIKNPHGAIVLVHGGPQAQWSMLLANLAKILSKQGWSTVLVNCNTDNSEPWAKELPEVVNTLRQQKNNRIVVLHYGEQLKQTMDLFGQSQKTNIEGLVLLSAYDAPDQAADKSESTKKDTDKKTELTLPLLDFAGQFDYDSVLRQMTARENTYPQKQYIAVTVPGAHHDYQYSRQFVSAFIQGWMSKLAEFKPVPPPVLVSYIESVEPLMPKELAMDDESDWSGYAELPPEEAVQVQ